MITETSSLTDVAFAVCTALSRVGVTGVLTGGSAATFYAPEAYQSLDLDFVITLRGDDGGANALRDLGFMQHGQFYRHPRTRFTLDFPRGPLAVGDDLITRWSTVRRGAEVLQVLSATDACRDRLASFLFWNDFSGLEQALAVLRAQRRKVNVALIREWCARERQAEKGELFFARAVKRAHNRS